MIRFKESQAMKDWEAYLKGPEGQKSKKRYWDQQDALEKSARDKRIGVPSGRTWTSRTASLNRKHG